MPIGGKLKLKGGQTIGKKKKKRKQKAPTEEGAEPAQQKYVAPDEHTEIATKVKTGQTYEEEFATEIERAKEGKLKSTPWGSSFGKAPEVLHGYDRKVTGQNAEERLDLRCARKTDKFCNLRRGGIMPLVMLCGQPSSGKSTLAAQLAQLFEKAGHLPIVVDESILHNDKNLAYADAAAEKNTRAAFKAEVDRRLSRKTVVVLDTLNNIKGFRYEIWCIARAVGTRSSVLHCDVPAEQCRDWNTGRAGGYSPAVFDDLAGRFERPDSRSRWDAPLFETRPGAAGTATVLDQVVAATLGTAGAASAPVPAREMVPTFATAPPQRAATNLLSDIDRAAQAVIGRIVEAQSTSGGAAGAVDGGEGTDQLILTEPITLPELRRHKRSFMKLATQNAFSHLQSSEAAERMFVSYLRDQLS